MIGKDVRLKQLFKHSRKLFILPMDHGITIGPVQGLNNISQLINHVKGDIDAIVVHKGMVSQVQPNLGPGACDLIIHLSASTTLAPNVDSKRLVTSVEHAIRLGATAVSVHVNLGSEEEVDMLEDMGMVSEACELWGMPLLAMMYVRDGIKENEYDLKKLKHAVRVAEELGADIVKINYSGNSNTFREVVNSVKIPVIIAGGPRMSSDLELLKTVHDAVGAGAMGVAFGRNVFQHPNPAPLAYAIRQILDSKVSEEDLILLAEGCKIEDNFEVE